MGTAYMQPRYRMLASLAMYAYFWIASDCECSLLSK
jgi:hypothetical protein